MRPFWISIFLLFLLSLPNHAQSDSIPSVIGLQDGEAFIFQADGSKTALGSGIVVHDTYENHLLYSRQLEAGSVALYYFDGQQGRLLSENVIQACPAQFYEDGSSVIYLQSASMTDEYYEINVMQQSLLENHAAERLGAVRFGIGGGGGGGPYYTNDEVYWDEVLTYPGVPALFEVTDYGIFYNANCSYYGLLMSSFTDPEPQRLADFFVWAISPDRTQIIGYEPIRAGEGNLVLYDVTSGTMEVIYAIPNLGYWSSEMYFQLYWTDANTLYYSTSHFSDSDYGLIDFDFNTENGLIPPHTATIQISRFDLSTRNAEIIYEQANSWAVGRMASDENYLYFSVIPDGGAIAAAYQAGTLLLDDVNGAKDLILPDIYRIPLAGGASELLYEDVSHFLLLSAPQ